LVSTVGEECCRPLGGACVQGHDAFGQGDCCSNSYDFTGTFYAGPCGGDGICGGDFAVCAVDSNCVGGSCRGKCNNRFPVTRCRSHEECDCEGDIEDGCVREVGFCIDKRCQ